MPTTITSARITPPPCLEVVKPLFKTRSVSTLNNYITYTGEKGRGYDPAALSAAAQLEEYQRLEKLLEAHCLSKEQALLELGTKLYAQIKTLDSQAIAHDVRIKELAETVAVKAKIIRDLEDGLKEARSSITDLRERAAKVEAEGTRLRATVADANAELAASQQQLLTIQTENAALLQRLEGTEAAGRKQLADREAILTARLRERESHLQALACQAENDLKRGVANQRMRDVARVSLPADARVLVISKGDDDLLRLDGRHGWHFPQTAGGVYAGYHPADSTQAIAHLETLRARGAEFLLIPATSFWWLDYYADFRRYLESQFRLLTYSQGTCVIYALDAPLAEIKNQLTVSFNGTPVKTSATPVVKRPADNQSPAPAGNSAQQNSQSPVALVHSKPVDKQPASTVAESGEAAGKTAAPAVLKPPVSLFVGVAPAEPSRRPSPGKPTVGCILDEFTAACFRPECELVTFRPDNWKRVLEQTPIDLLFIESAWQGNGGSWQYKIASFKKPMGEELLDVVSYCKERNIPTAFWNKEDPPHFDRFIHRAPLFDYVFTSDAEMIPKYRDAVKHSRVMALPFAAQPKLHYPIVEADRPHNVCFAGAYYALDHDERRADMDHLLRPALGFGLHIYDRQHGLAGSAAKHYQFPAIYQPAIKGRLEYEEMVKAYKLYKAFLNVNSVKESPTMFSRRVFELLASGTPVISAYSLGIIKLLGADLVHISTSERETKAHLEHLLSNDSYWAQVSLQGIRAVYTRHTYAHRFAEICRTVGLPFAGQPHPRIAVVSRADTSENLQRLVKTLARQTYQRFTLSLVVGKAITKAGIRRTHEALPDIAVHVLPQATAVVELLLKAEEADYVWLVNLEDYYGDNFLNDATIAAIYSGADVLGKETHFETSAAGKQPNLVLTGQEMRWVKNVSPGSILAKTGKLDADQWRALAANRWPPMPELRVLSLDRFNYVKRGGGIGGSPGRKALTDVLV